MNVKELIDKLIAECGDRDPSTVKVEKRFPDYSTNDDWMEDIFEEVYDVASYGGNDFPLVVVVR